MAWSQVLSMPSVAAVTTSPLYQWLGRGSGTGSSWACCKYSICWCWHLPGAVVADCCQEPDSWEQLRDPGPPVRPHSQATHRSRAPGPFSSTVPHWGCLFPVSNKTWAVSLIGPTLTPQRRGVVRGNIEDHWGGRGIPRGSVTWPSCRFFTSCASQRFVVVSSFSTWAKVVSFSWSGRHCLSASRALHQKQTNQPERQQISLHLGAGKTPLLRYKYITS